MSIQRVTAACDWYQQCLHKIEPCDQDPANEYAMSYGYKYCTEYERNLKNFSTKGQTWIAKVRKCLQKALSYSVGRAYGCKFIQDSAFNSHSKCYVDSGLCDLPPEDWNQILKITGSEFFSGDAKLKTWLNAGGASARCYGHFRTYFFRQSLSKDIPLPIPFPLGRPILG